MNLFVFLLFLLHIPWTIFALRDRSGGSTAVNGVTYQLEKRLYVHENSNIKLRNGEVYKACRKDNRQVCVAIKYSDLTRANAQEQDVLEALKGTKYTIKQFYAGVTTLSLTSRTFFRKMYTQVFELAEETLLTIKISSPEMVYSIWTQLLLGVEEMHCRRYVHNDLKLENVGLVRGTVKLMDFDVSFKMREGEQFATFKLPAYTPYYSMPPEKITPIKSGLFRVGPQADMWSLGMILYKLIYNKNAFDFVPEEKREQCVLSPDCVFPNLPLVFPDLEPLKNMALQCLRRGDSSRPTLKELIKETASILRSRRYSFPAAADLFQL